ncbi:uncharacterized protein LAJ45_05059 [Morchella importuna]|uniref:Uncharacterized protein n=1 Tax=Morchella conica CCBAS932 TaxID=1392247 RepID=A0A3N4KXI3_9PEZI|nr:uncharacterized protein LAJ45_05059 [Morchella importuna]KAH8150877.1 hypothetical protein LAJ45_05059 [Morchella importuna]RPB14119.1 hypothetical protein P167DRAFT_503934 [Morchella conica CCBAS932]
MFTHLLFLATSLGTVSAARELWFNQPAWDWASQALPIGNGKHAASFFGGINNDSWALNSDSLWTGGPFQLKNYTGGNPAESRVPALRGIQDFIFKNGTGSIAGILGSDAGYGSYSVLGNLSVGLDLDAATASSYKLWLDIDRGVGGSSFVTEKYGKITRDYFCSFPAQACIYHLESTKPLPTVTVSLGSTRSPAPTITTASNTITLRGLAESPDGMLYDARAAIVFPGTAQKGKDFTTSTGLSVPATAGVKELWIVLSMDTNYDETKGNPSDGYTFQGIDPAKKVAGNVAAAASKSYNALLAEHIKDHQALYRAFSLTLPDPLGSASKATDELMKAYTLDKGDPYLESLLFDFGRYLLIGSSRPNSLPPNLQGKWSNGFGAAWSGDYHTNINLQMNVWGSEATGLGGTLDGLWRYMTETWVPRGSETASLLYGATEGWVVHNEINTFGHTGLKGNGDQSTALWFAYSAANAWMMQHVWDHYDFTGDKDWYKSVGYPLIKGVAQFHLSTLLEDKYYNDGTLVVNPCNSPEQPPSTFGCAIDQQQISEVFMNVLKGWDASGDKDLAFKKRVEDALSKLYTGIRVGRYGQIQEWKLDIDNPEDGHRHLSHLYGWYPGYSISSVHRENTTITKAVETTLIHRGLGKWTDANAGWEKVWRGACWAGLNNSTMSYYELRFAIVENFANNLYSVYSKDPSTIGTWVFQIDANFGTVGQVLHMFVHDLDVGYGQSGEKTVVLAPAVPEAWWGSKIEGHRLRGGGEVSFEVSGEGKVKSVVLKSRKSSAPKLKFVDATGKELEVKRS